MTYAFYSFKGGVGRSMALANVAEVLCEKRLKVLMVDFDLEAPGLEQYFQGFLPTSGSGKASASPGVVDLLEKYKELRDLSAPRTLPTNATMDDRIALLATPRFADYLLTVRDGGQGQGSILLMTAGSRSKTDYYLYAKRVLSFSWEDFYLAYDGEIFFEWFRKEAENAADVVLIDSRTGVSEMSGVCTHQLADVVVSFVAANAQNIEGVMHTAGGLADPALLKEGRHGRPLSQVLVPARVEISEGDQAKKFQDDLRKRISGSFASGIPGQGSISFELAIPYVPVFAFNERVPAREPDHPLSKLILDPIRALTGVMASFAPADSRLYNRHHSTAESLAKVAEQKLASWAEDKQTATCAVLERLVSVSVSRQSKTSAFSARQVLMDEFPNELREQCRELEKLGMLTFDLRGNELLVSFADVRLLDTWRRLKDWVNTDLEFLDWRQRVSAGCAEWKKSHSEKDLLSGTPLTEARRWRREKASALNEQEKEFIDESQSYELRSQLETQSRAPAPKPLLVPETQTTSSMVMSVRESTSSSAAIIFIGYGTRNVSGAWGDFPRLLCEDSRLSSWDMYQAGFANELRFDLLGLWRPRVSFEVLTKQLCEACKIGPLRRYKALVLVAHSVGGLVTQRALVDDSVLRQRTTHLFLFGTPSAGLTKAGPFSFLRRQATDLGEKSRFIIDLRERWEQEIGDKPPFVCRVIAAELDQFVPPSSSLEPFPEDLRLVVPGNHITMVQPKESTDIPVQIVADGIVSGTKPLGNEDKARLAIESRRFDEAVSRLWPTRDKLDERVLLDLCIALDQLGRRKDAIELLNGRGRDELDTCSVLAARFKRRWLGERRRSDAESAYELYNQAFGAAVARVHVEKILHCGTNVAFMQLAYLSDLAGARETAIRILSYAERTTPDLWTLASEGEALLILGRVSEALSRYQDALQKDILQWQKDAIYQTAFRIADLTGDEDAQAELALIFGNEPPFDSSPRARAALT